MKIIKIDKGFIVASYELVDANLFSVGNTVSQDVYIKKSSAYVIIIEANTLITQKILSLLNRQNALYVLGEKSDTLTTPTLIVDSKNIDCSSLLNKIRHDKNDIIKTLVLVKNVNENIFSNFAQSDHDKIDLICIRNIVRGIIYLIKNNDNYLKSIMPYLDNNHLLPTHSLNSMIYSLHVGELLFFDDEELLKLGIAALTHNIGQKSILAIINKESKLTPEELKLVQKHPKYSVDILKKNNITDKQILNAVKHHHERQDGSGYPDKLKGTKISKYASIIAICDVFDALTIDRPYRKRYSTFEALKIIMKDPLNQNKFDNDYVKLLLV